LKVNVRTNQANEVPGDAPALSWRDSRNENMNFGWPDLPRGGWGHHGVVSGQGPKEAHSEYSQATKKVAWGLAIPKTKGRNLVRGPVVERFTKRQRGCPVRTYEGGFRPLTTRNFLRSVGKGRGRRGLTPISGHDANQNPRE